VRHTPDSRPGRELKLGDKHVKLTLDGVEIGPRGPVKETTEAKPKPPQPDDPRPAFFRNIPPYGAA
jgi:hypothetical protein